MQALAHRVSVLVLAFGVGVSVGPSCLGVKSLYEKSVRLSKEAKLRKDLSKLRRLMKEYSANKGGGPNLVTDLVYAGYIDQIPADPFTGRRYSRIVYISTPIENPCAIYPVTVISESEEISTEGTSYDEW